MAERKFHYMLTFRAPVGVFTGLGVAGLVDRTVVRAANEKPYIPGSTVKGRLRFFAERVLRNFSDPSNGVSIHSGDMHCKRREDACTICRLFGNPALPALLNVGPAWPNKAWEQRYLTALKENVNPVLKPDAEIRPGIAVSRLRRVALKDHLFMDETIPATVFKGTLFLDRRVSDPDERFLIGVGRLVDGLGSRKAIGRGRLENGIEISREKFA